MKTFRYDQIKELVERFDSLPDAAFLSALAENGVDADDLLAYSRERTKREAALRAARRR